MEQKTTLSVAGILFVKTRVLGYNHIKDLNRILEEKFGIHVPVYYRHAMHVYGQDSNMSIPCLIACTDSFMTLILADYLQSYAKVQNRTDVWESCKESVKWFDVLYEEEMHDVCRYVIRFDEDKIRYNLFLGELSS